MRVGSILPALFVLLSVLIWAPMAHADTILNIGGCTGPALGGTILPGVPFVTSTDCTIVFGSNTDQAGIRIHQQDLAGAAIPGVADYADTLTDWNQGASMFGACLRAVGAGTTPTWSVDGNATCTEFDTDPWRPVGSSAGVAAEVATTTGIGINNASISLRFGIRVPSNHAPGVLTAPTTITVLAPNIDPPVNGTLPSIAGTANDGSLLTANPGIWTGGPTYTYQWRRCDAAGAACGDIGGATASTYSLVSADVGSTIRVVVTGTNAAGSSNGTSVQTARVTGDVPVNTVLPTTSGTANAGELLTAGNGTWSGTTALSYTYQWRRCDSVGAACVDIGGATASTFALTSTDVGSTLRVVVTATNTCWSGCAAVPATSAASARVTGDMPVNTVLPTATGTATEGQTLNSTLGTWTGEPVPGLTRQWLRCTTTLIGSCANIAGQTGATYLLAAADVGNYIRMRVTGTNACWSGCGAVSADSTALGPVAAGGCAPVNTVPPTFSPTGTRPVGTVFNKTNDGTWTCTPTSFTYQWTACGGTPIPGATGASFTATAAENNKEIKLRVTASNAFGSNPATSSSTAVINALGC